MKFYLGIEWQILGADLAALAGQPVAECELGIKFRVACLCLGLSPFSELLLLGFLSLERHVSNELRSIADGTADLGVLFRTLSLRECLL